MKLNPDCIRDILLAVEEVTDSSRSFRYGKASPVPEQLNQYTHNEIWYHMRQCNASGLFIGFTASDNGNLVIIRDLDPKGHDLLNSIRDPGLADKMKSALGKVGSPTIGMMLRIGENLVTEYLSKLL